MTNLLKSEEGHALGRKVCMVTSAHDACDVRIFKEATALSEAGFEVFIVGPHSGPTIIDGIAIRSIPAWKKRSDRVLSILRCFRRAMDVGAQVYHLHDPELLAIALPLKVLTGSSVVYDCHEYTALDVLLFKPWIPRPIRRPLSWFVKWFEPFVARFIDGVVAVLEDMTGEFANVNPNAVTVHNYSSAQIYLQSNRKEIESPSIVYFGQVNPERGLCTILRTMSLLQQQLPMVVCYVVGQVNGLSTCGFERLPPNVVFTGRLPQQEAYGYLKSADVGWIPLEESRYNQLGVPNKLSDYLLAGLPIVASDVGRVGAIVKLHACGLVAEPGNAEAHASALLSLIRNQPLRQSLAENSRKAGSRHFNWESEKEILVGFYEHLLERRRL